MGRIFSSIYMTLRRLKAGGFRTYHRNTILLIRFLVRGLRFSCKFHAKGIHINLFSVLLRRDTRNVIFHCLLRKRVNVGALLKGPEADRVEVRFGRDTSRQLTVTGSRDVKRSEANISSILRQNKTSILTSNYSSSILLTTNSVRRSVVISNPRVTNPRPAVERFSFDNLLEVLMMTGGGVKTRSLRLTVVVNTRARAQPKLAGKASTVHVLPISSRQDHNFHRAMPLGRHSTVRTVRRINGISIRQNTTTYRVFRIQAGHKAGKLTSSKRRRKVLNSNRRQVVSPILLILKPLRRVVRHLNRSPTTGAHANLLQNDIMRFFRRA